MLENTSENLVSPSCKFSLKQFVQTKIFRKFEVKFPLTKIKPPKKYAWIFERAGRIQLTP